MGYVTDNTCLKLTVDLNKKRLDGVKTKTRDNVWWLKCAGSSRSYKDLIFSSHLVMMIWAFPNLLMLCRWLLSKSE